MCTLRRVPMIRSDLNVFFTVILIHADRGFPPEDAGDCGIGRLAARRECCDGLHRVLLQTEVIFIHQSAHGAGLNNAPSSG